MSHIKGCLFFLPFFLGGIFSSFVQADKKLEERVLFLGLPTGIFTSIDFIRKEDKVLIVDKRTALDPHHQDELSQYDEVIPVDDYYNSGEVTLAALKSFADKPYSTLIALSESDILRAGALRDYLHIKGQSLSSAEAFRNKVVMKDTLEKNGIKTAPFTPLKTELDLIRFIELNGYPVIIKPRKAYGAIETYVLKSKDDLEAILKTKNVFDEFQNEKFFVESFIDGDMYHVDGLIYKGKIVFICPSEYTSPCLEMNKAENSHRKGYSASYILPSEAPVAKELISLTQKVLKALPTPQNSAFFLEVFRDKKGEFIVCEIASRVGGYPNPHVLWKAFSIDLKKEFIRLQTGLPPSFSWKNKAKEYFGAIALGTEKGQFKGLDKKLSDIKEKKLFVNEGESYDTTSGYLSLAASFVLPVKDKEHFIKQTEDIATSFYSKDCWDIK